MNEAIKKEYERILGKKTFNEMEEAMWKLIKRIIGHPETAYMTLHGNVKTIFSDDCNGGECYEHIWEHAKCAADTVSGLSVYEVEIKIIRKL